MAGEVQYGGRITDDLDRRLFSAYTEAWLSAPTLNPNFSFNPDSPINKIPVNQLLDTIVETQPKQSSGSAGGKTRGFDFPYFSQLLVKGLTCEPTLIIQCRGNRLREVQ
eukprot:gene40753-55096_t